MAIGRGSIRHISALTCAFTGNQPCARALISALSFVSFLYASAAAPAGAAQDVRVAAANANASQSAKAWHHALSLVSKPEYGPDFAHFKWVNPEAPKGGLVRLTAIGTFDSLNPFPIKGNPATSLGLIYDRLMMVSSDEGSTIYGLIAEAVSYPPDYSSVTFRLREGARFHDGEPIKPEDVIFSLNELKRVNPFYLAYYKNVVRAEKTGPREVTFYFDKKNNRELPFITAELFVLPKHYWTGTGKDGKPRDLAKSTLEVPLGSGPYRIAEVKPGRSITYERVADYWAKDLPVTRGRWNFDRIRFEYFRDTTVAFEAFKAGKIDFTQENNSKRWATAYDFPAVADGLVKRETLAIKRVAGMQGFVFNLRRRKFQDPRVRRAFNLAFDFEWSNKNLFYGLYRRLNSYFDNSELAARGLPKGKELEILEEVRELVPAEVFTKPYENPVNNSPRDLRKHLREAAALFRAAGWRIKDGVLTHEKTGERMEVEFLLVQPAFERIVLPYVRNLSRLGVKASVRVVDTSQYRQRTDHFDYDMIVWSFGQSESPGNEQRDYWSSAAADKPGSRNMIGIKNPAVDKLIDRIIFARNRAELVAATRALDRVLLWNHYVVPHWYNPVAWLAYWDKFRHPEPHPRRSVAFLEVWWLDGAKAARLAEVGK